MAPESGSQAAENRERTERLFTALNERDVTTIVDLVDEGLVHHALGPDSTTEGRDEWIDRIAAFGVAFPDLSVDIEDMVAEDDRVMCRIRMAGTFTEAFDGQAPTGRSAETSGFHALRFEDGQVVEWWRLNNLFDWAQQIDALPLGPRSLIRIGLRQLKWKLAGD